MDLVWVRGLTSRVTSKFCVPCNLGRHEALKPDFFEEKDEDGKSAYVHLEGIAKSFSLMCSSLPSGIIWTRGIMSCTPKVFFSSAHVDHILTLRPQFFFRNDEMKSKYEFDL